MKTFSLSSIITGTVLVATLMACGSKTKPQEPEKKDPYARMKTMNWVVGKWELVNKDTVSTEIWQLKNDSVYAGISMDVKGGKDTIRYEDATIEQRGTEIYFIPVMKDQNEGKPVEFKMTATASTDTRLVFENPQHDFPKKIIYEIKGDSLLASISGPMKGQEVTIPFPMVKKK